MKRREFIAASRRRGGSWPLAARAQQAERVRRVGVLMPAAADDRGMPEPASRRSCRGCSNRAGPSVATCGSTSAGRRRRCRRHSQARGGAGRARTGRHSGTCGSSSVGTAAAGDPHRADRVHERHRPGRRRLRRQPGAAGRQRHRIHPVRIRHSAGNGWNCSRRSRQA